MKGLISMTSHLNTAVNRLLDRKASLESRIAEEMKRPLPDVQKLQGLKRLRLSLKDRIHRLLGAQNGRGPVRPPASMG